MSKAQVSNEVKVRIRSATEKRRFSVMKFNGTNVGIQRWTNRDCKVKMEREDNRAELGLLDDSQQYGEGSEYGRAAREEARRKKYGRQRKSYQHDMQPWRLHVSDAGKERKFRSIREGGAGEHADYWVFLKKGEDFVAHKITDWYKFLPCVTHRTLDIDQAEAQFQQRSRVMNQFALKAQIQKTLNSTDAEAEDVVKGSGLKIKDNYSSEEEESDSDESKPGDEKKKKKKNVRERKDKRQRVNNADEVAAYESEDGEDEGREYDYMTDSGSDSDRDTKTAEEKIDEAMIGVGDETGLKSQIMFDLSSSSDEEDEESDKDQQPEKAEDSIIEEKKKSTVVYDHKDSSDSDSDDPDKNPFNSVVFLEDKSGPAQLGDVPTNGRAKKRAMGDVSETATKRMKMQDNKVKQEVSAAAQAIARQRELAVPDGLNEDTVRKYLRQKPHTTKDLIQRFKAKCPPEMNKAEIVTHLAAILKKIEPQQFKQFKRKQGKKKEVLFFSLANVAK
uniref:Transcription initiation factor IIF subunit alpha n=1 Tax=Steinernema glaseri TaxID=37863 RepID=A0A1I8ATP4_9BILA